MNRCAHEEREHAPAPTTSLIDRFHALPLHRRRTVYKIGSVVIGDISPVSGGANGAIEREAARPVRISRRGFWCEEQEADPAGAFALARLLEGLVFDVSTADPAMFVAMAMLLGITGLVACWLPARRASGIDPVEAIRTE